MIAPARRWLTRRARTPPIIRASVAVVLGALALIGLSAPTSSGQPGAPAAGRAAGPTTGSPTEGGGAALSASGNGATKPPDPPGPGNPTRSFPTSPALVAQGFNLYQNACASCHGIALQGQHGVAPSLIGVGPGPVDFYLSTGRMPLETPHEEPLRSKPQFDRGQIDALIAYISTFGGPPAPTANPAHGDLAVGLRTFTLHCAGCHQIVARGGMTVGALIPNLQSATPQEIAEAVRMGPYLMPRFDATQIDQHQLDSIARYILWTRSPQNAGGWGIYNLGPIPEGIVAWFLALAAMVLGARLIGERLA